MQVKRGDERTVCWVLQMAFLCILCACSPAYRCQLLNQTGSTVTAVSAGKVMVIPPNESRVLYISSNRLTLSQGGDLMVYHLNVQQLSRDYMKYKVRGYLFYAVLMQDRHIYLATKSSAGDVSIRSDQVPPFPLKPEKNG